MAREIPEGRAVELLIEVLYVFADHVPRNSSLIGRTHVRSYLMDLLDSVLVHSDLSPMQSFKLGCAMRMCKAQHKFPLSAAFRGAQMEYLLIPDSLALLPFPFPATAPAKWGADAGSMPTARYVDVMEEALWKMSESLSPCEAVKETLADVYAAVNAEVEELFGVRALLFGSCSNGFSILSSDIDLLVQLPPETSKEFVREAVAQKRSGAPDARTYSVSGGSDSAWEWLKRHCAAGIWAGRKLAERCRRKGWKVDCVEGAKFPIVHLKYPLHLYKGPNEIPEVFKSAGAADKKEIKRMKTREQKQARKDKKKKNATKEKANQPSQDGGDVDKFVPNGTGAEGLEEDCEEEADEDEQGEEEANHEAGEEDQRYGPDDHHTAALGQLALSEGEEYVECYVDVDVSFNHEVVLHNSRLLRTYAMFDSRVPALGRLVKHWAKQRDICDSFRGTLSGYAWLNLVIYFCQRHLVLPARLLSFYNTMQNNSCPRTRAALHLAQAPDAAFVGTPEWTASHAKSFMSHGDSLPVLPNLQDPPAEFHPLHSRLVETEDRHRHNVFFYHPHYGANTLVHAANQHHLSHQSQASDSRWIEEDLAHPPLEYARRQLGAGVAEQRTKSAVKETMKERWLRHSRPRGPGEAVGAEARCIHSSISYGDGTLYSMLYNFFRFYCAHFNFYSHVVDMSRPPLPPLSKHQAFSIESSGSSGHLPSPPGPPTVTSTAGDGSPLDADSASGEDGEDDEGGEEEEICKQPGHWLRRRPFLCIQDPFESNVLLGSFRLGQEFISFELLRSVSELGVSPLGRSMFPERRVADVLLALFAEDEKGDGRKGGVKQTSSKDSNYTHPSLAKLGQLNILVPDTFIYKPPPPWSGPQPRPHPPMPPPAMAAQRPPVGPRKLWYPATIPANKNKQGRKAKGPSGGQAKGPSGGQANGQSGGGLAKGPGVTSTQQQLVDTRRMEKGGSPSSNAQFMVESADSFLLARGVDWHVGQQHINNNSSFRSDGRMAAGGRGGGVAVNRRGGMQHQGGVMNQSQPGKPHALGAAVDRGPPLMSFAPAVGGGRPLRARGGELADGKEQGRMLLQYARGEGGRGGRGMR
eukprot:GHVS01010543.1.p1 GENE.GHVS01010543.1~~GHVS01010543.1.p1  ORF type:complete len:1090 (-),score=201.76 GHVS01010543.1:215-3484(-)